MFSQHKVKDQRSENGVLVGEKDNGALSVYAPNLTTLLNHIAIAYPTPRNDGSSSKRKEGRDDFYALDTYEEAYEIFTQRPWEVVNFTPVDHTLHSPDSAGMQVYFDVTGDYLDVDRFLSDEPEHFGNTTLGNPRGLFITIYASANSSWHISEAALKVKQQRIVALIDWLEASNIRTRLVAINDNDVGYVETVLKDYHDSVDLNPIAVAFHPDYLRRIIFRIKEYSKTWNAGYGSSVSNIKVDEQGLSIQIPSNQGEADEVNRYFDNLIKTIERKIEEGDTLGTIGGE